MVAMVTKTVDSSRP